MNYLLFLQSFRDKYRGIEDKHLLYNYLREELQYLILGFLYSKTTYPLYFMGGTQLRLSYKINRFSEDLDFALDKPDPHFPAQDLYDQLLVGFSEKITGFRVHGRFNAQRNVIKIMLSFAQILHDLELSPLPDETIKIKLEVDVNPPDHASPIQKQYSSFMGDYRVNVHDLSTGFAGKLGAVLLREYQKGRDYFDLQWYLKQSPPLVLNLGYLNANCVQQQKEIFKDAHDVLGKVTLQIQALNLDLMKQDLERFVMMDPKSFAAWLSAYVPETMALLNVYQKHP